MGVFSGQDEEKEGTKQHLISHSKTNQKTWKRRVRCSSSQTESFFQETFHENKGTKRLR